MVTSKQRIKELMLQDSMIEGLKRWKSNERLNNTNVTVNCFPRAYEKDRKH